MKFSSMKPPSKYLAKEDLPNGKMVATVRAFTQDNLARQGAAPEIKWLIWFNETPKAMVFNPTNRQLLCMALNIDPVSGDTDEAIGKRIVIFNDPSVRGLDGNLVGGIRIRAYNPRPVANGAPANGGTGKPAAVWPSGPPATAAREPGSDDDFDSHLTDEF